MCIIFGKPNDYFTFAIIGMGVFCFFWSIRNYILFLDSIVYWPASLTYVVYLSHKWINELNIIGTYFGTSWLRIFVVFFVVIIVSFFVHIVIERPGVAIGRSILRKKQFL
jgi:peptidoglycan/LPS O-acetylase OafA/YrhL